MRAEGRNMFCIKFLVGSLGLFTGSFLRTSAFFCGRKLTLLRHVVLLGHFLPERMNRFSSRYAEYRNVFCMKFFADSLVYHFRKDCLPEIFCEPQRSSAGENLLPVYTCGASWAFFTGKKE